MNAWLEERQRTTFEAEADGYKSGYRDGFTAALEQAAQKCDDVKNDAQEKLGLVPGNTAFENGRSKAADEIKELIAAIGNDKE